MTEREKTREQLSAYLDGELSPQEARRVEQAVQADAELAKELSGIRATRDLIRRLPRRHAPADFVERVLAQTERLHLMEAPSAKAHARPMDWARYLATAAVLLIAAGIGVVIAVALRTTSDLKDRTVGGGPETPVIAQGDGAARRGGREVLDEKAKSDEAALAKKLSPETLVAAAYHKGAVDDYREFLKDRGRFKSSAERKIVLDVPDLNAGKNAVESILRSRGIEPLEEEKGRARSAGNIASNGNYVTDDTDRNQVQILVCLTPSEVPKLEADLDNNDILAQQGGIRREDAADKAAGIMPKGGYGKIAAKDEGGEQRGPAPTVAYAGQSQARSSAGQKEMKQGESVAPGPATQPAATPEALAPAPGAGTPAPSGKPTEPAKAAEAGRQQAPGEQIAHGGWAHEEMTQERLRLFQAPADAKWQQKFSGQPAEQEAQAVQRVQAAQPAAQAEGTKARAVLITLNLKVGGNLTATSNLAASAPATGAANAFQDAERTTAPAQK